MDKRNDRIRASGNSVSFQGMVVILVAGLILSTSGTNTFRSSLAFAQEEQGEGTTESILADVPTDVQEETATEPVSSSTLFENNPVVNALSEIIAPTSELTPVQESETISSTTSLDTASSSENTDTATTTGISTTTENQSTLSATATSSDSEESSSTIPATTTATSSDTTHRESVSQTPAQEEKPVLSLDAPRIVSVISPILSGTFKYGRIPVLVSFDQKIFVTGTPQLAIAVGSGKITNATYTSGSGSQYLVFLYYIKAGDETDSLDYASSDALSLNGGSITSKNGLTADLVLPTPGMEGSLSATTDIIIHTKK